MKEIMKDLFKSILISIEMSLTIFCVVGMAFDIGYGGHFSLEDYRFTRMVAGCALIGIGFGAPTVVYRIDSLPMPIRVIIHMGIGCTVYTIVAFSVGWITGAASVGQGILIACIQLAVAFVIWFLFMIHYRKEAKEMNEKIQALK